jgi:hypothetical protein
MAHRDRAYVPGTARPFLTDAGLVGELRRLFRAQEARGADLVNGAVDPNALDELMFTAETVNPENMTATVQYTPYDVNGRVFCNDYADADGTPRALGPDTRFKMLRTRFVGAHARNSSGLRRTFKIMDGFRTGIEPRGTSDKFTADRCISYDGGATSSGFATGNAVSAGGDAPCNCDLTSMVMRWYVEQIRDPATGCQQFFVPSVARQPQNRVFSLRNPAPHSQSDLHAALGSTISQFDFSIFVAVVVHPAGEHDSRVYLLFPFPGNICGPPRPDLIIAVDHTYITRNTSKHVLYFLDPNPRVRQATRKTRRLAQAKAAGPSARKASARKA